MLVLVLVLTLFAVGSSVLEPSLAESKLALEQVQVAQYVRCQPVRCVSALQPQVSAVPLLAARMSVDQVIRCTREAGGHAPNLLRPER